MKKWIKIGIGVLLVAMWMERGRASEDCGPCMEPNDATITMGGGSNCIPSAAGTAVPSEPCKECDGAGGITNKPDSDTCCGGYSFDPAAEGCCKKPDGSGSQKTSNPDGADVCSQACTLPEASDPDNKGATICYNGHLHTCTFDCNIPSDWDPNVIDCIIEHENVHSNDPNFRCESCDLHVGGWTNDAQGVAGECAAYQKSLDCLNGIGGMPNGWMYLWDFAVQKMKELNCP